MRSNQPWSVYELDWRSVVDPDGHVVCDIRTSDPHDASLIAAAPELLEACELAESMLRDGGTFPINGQTWMLLAAAIKKASGTK